MRIGTAGKIKLSRKLGEDVDKYVDILIYKMDDSGEYDVELFPPIWIYDHFFDSVDEAVSEIDGRWNFPEKVVEWNQEFLQRYTSPQLLDMLRS